ncbi:hypothetical protein KY366_06945 [Candidatus Woesearchaeota archaeon]|nr:hypothetical protein [Candidatus Woesearchaeota archaeon]
MSLDTVLTWAIFMLVINLGFAGFWFFGLVGYWRQKFPDDFEKNKNKPFFWSMALFNGKNLPNDAKLKSKLIITRFLFATLILMFAIVFILGNID